MDTPPVIPDLTLLRRIGGGSYGDVWLARTITGVYRAVKIVDKARFADERPFLRELDGISRFQRSVGDQPRQLALMHVGRLDERGIFYYTMELADDVEAGTDIDPDKYQPLTLKALCERRPDLPAAEVVRIGVELARSLEGLHGAGLIHRDVKPSNIIFVAGVPKLADIGLVSSSDHTLTSLGTPGYSPPEGAGTTRADIYSLGKILYQLATGQHPDEFPRLPRDVAAREDARALFELNEIVLKACQPDPDGRYGSAQAMLDDLLLLQAGRSVKELNAMRERLRLLGRVALWCGAAALVVIGVLGVRNYFALRELAATEQRARIQAEEDERLARYTANLHVAQLAFASGDVGVARAALRRDMPAHGEVDRRGLEWYALWNETSGNATRVLGQVGEPGMEAMVLAPGGRVAAVLRTTPARELVLWDRVSGESRVLHRGVARLGGFTATGEAIVVGLNDGTLRLLSVADGQVGAALREDVRVVDHTERSVLLGSPREAPMRLSVWEEETRQEIGLWSAGDELDAARLVRATVSPDHALLAICIERGRGPDLANEVLVWDLGAGAYRFRLASLGRVNAFRFSRDSARLAIASSFEPLRVFDVATGVLERELAAVPPLSAALEFSPSDARLACAGLDGVIRVLDPQTGALVRELDGNESGIEKWALAWSDDGNTLLSAGTDGAIREWDLDTGPRSVARRGYWQGLLGNPLWLPDGMSLAVTRRDGRLARIDVGTLEPQGEPWDAFQALGVAGEGLRALNREHALVVIDPIGGAVQQTSLRLEGAATLCATAASSDAEIVGLGQADGTFTVWDVGARAVVLSERAHDSAIWACAVSPGGEWAVTGDERGRVLLWQPREARAAREILDLGEAVSALAFSHDGTRCVIFTRTGEMLSWGMSGQAVEFRGIAHAQGCTSATFSGDDSRLITAGYDGMLLVWTVPGFRQLAALSFDPRAAARAAVCALAVSPGGGALVAFTEDGVLRRWSLAQ